jgi:hypothetical protein
LDVVDQARKRLKVVPGIRARVVHLMPRVAAGQVELPVELDVADLLPGKTGVRERAPAASRVEVLGLEHRDRILVLGDPDGSREDLLIALRRHVEGRVELGERFLRRDAIALGVELEPVDVEIEAGDDDIARHGAVEVGRGELRQAVRRSHEAREGVALVRPDVVALPPGRVGVPAVVARPGDELKRVLIAEPSVARLIRALVGSFALGHVAPTCVRTVLNCVHAAVGRKEDVVRVAKP